MALLDHEQLRLSPCMRRDQGTHEGRCAWHKRLESAILASKIPMQGANTRLDYSLQFQVLESELPVCCRPSDLVYLVLAIPQQARLIRVHDDQAKGKSDVCGCRSLHIDDDGGSLMRKSPDQMPQGPSEGRPPANLPHSRPSS